jgi:ubiquinone/menaquinone biosynthesis C-methylase UbiE
MDWNTIYEHAELPNFRRLIRHPDEWQAKLAQKIGVAVGSGTLLEAGCGYGLTSLLAGARSRRTLLDLEPKAVEIASALFTFAGQEAYFAVGNIFSMPFGDNSFDVVFNAGVLEHFDLSSRRAALLEMVRVTKPGGKVFVAIPNHHSIPYRKAYEYRKARGEWPFPDEEMIYDFSAELAETSGVIQVGRETVAPKSSLYYLSRVQKAWFVILYAFKRFEGYLTIITLEKADSSDSAPRE